VKSQEEIIKKYQTQVLLPREKINQNIVDDLELALIETEQEQEYDSL
jgi:hypothetical protein